MAMTLSTQISGAQKSMEEIEALFSCPLSLDTLVDPVMDKCGHTFERTQIEDWLKKNNTCPLSRERINIEDLDPNLVVKQAIGILKHRGRAIDGNVVADDENEREIMSKAVKQLHPKTFAKKSADSVEKTLNYVSSSC